MPIKKPFAFEKILKKRGFQTIAGVDEAGRGPLAGPVVAAACIFTKHSSKLLLDDSKALSEKNRKEIYTALISDPKILTGVGIVEPSRIDEVNILKASLEAMQKALKNLTIEPDYALVDGNQSFLFSCPVETIIKGDSVCSSIAAASIIAKEVRDEIMKNYHKQYPEYDFVSNKGYATKFHLKALKIHGPTPIHRTSFAPLKQKLEQLQLF